MKSWSDGDGNSGLCGFEGAKPGAASESPREEVGRPFDGRADGKRKGGSERGLHSKFPVTIA